jgi:hypothetical protein
MQLDDDIRRALESLQGGRTAKAFDPEAYIRAFEESAHAKARAVLELLSQQPPFATLTPVFLSVGGGDGAELQYLLEHSDGTAGVLIEGERTLADMARQRAQKLRPRGLVIEVFEGDAKQKVTEAVAHATALVAARAGNYVCITCHAVLHELFDRGAGGKFETPRFFGDIFADYTTSTWFTYREPGLPDKWPEVVLLKAACQPQSLLLLAQEICRRHQSMRDLRPEPHVLGDHIRMSRALAMEVLTKLFYLEDLSHEIEERSTAVSHSQLTNMLWYAIGERARDESRANITSISQPTGSFVACWEKYGVSVLGMNDDGSSFRLPVAESQTRVIAWRLAENESRIPLSPAQPKLEDNAEDPVAQELALAEQCVRDREEELLTALLAAKGRAWIESPFCERALAVLNDIEQSFAPAHGCRLWAHYLLCLSRLFAGATVRPDDFSEDLIAAASQIGAGLLFRAERMEFSRKCGQLDEALAIANGLQMSQRESKVPSSDTDRYVRGTAAFLMGNLLRHGGLYQRAWEQINTAQLILRPGSPAQATELAHCYYAKAVCVSMTGASQFDAPFAEARHSGSRRFANALITLSYSHAAWFVGDVLRARQYALQAAGQFADLGYGKYAARASDLASLLGWWQSLQSGKRLNFELENAELTMIVKLLVGYESDLAQLSTLFPNLRPSVAIGLLQFWQAYGKQTSSVELALPPVLNADTDGVLRWDKARRVPIGEADQFLRRSCSVPEGLRVPLIAD